MALVLKTAVLSLGLNYAVHYASARLYDMVCVPHTLSEFVQTLATTASPVCSTVLSIMSTTQLNYGTIVTTVVSTAITNGLRI